MNTPGVLTGMLSLLGYIERALVFLFPHNKIKMTRTIRTGSKDSSLVKQRRQEIARKASSVIVKNGYYQTGVREIAAACDMSMGALYNYVGSKEDILYLVLQYGVSRFKVFHQKALDKFMKMSPALGLREAIGHYCKLVDSSSENVLFAYLETKRLPAEYRDTSLGSELNVVEKFKKLLVRGCKAGEFDVADPYLTAMHITTSCEMWATRRWFLKKGMSLQEFIDRQAELILRSVVSDGHVRQQPKTVVRQRKARNAINNVTKVGRKQGKK